MICSCGGLLKASNYQTKDRVQHEIRTCVACGRRIEWHRKDGKVIRQKG